MSSPIQFGLAIRGQYDQADDISERFEGMVAQAKRADELGFASITKTSHYSTSPFQALQQFPVLARLSGEVKRARLNAGIVLLSLHKPLDIAEQLATIDVMSGGRLIFGAAIGYREVELAAFGTTRKERGKRFEENLTAVKRLWTEDTVSMKGSHFELIDAACSVKPLQKPHPPIWIGANADVAIKRAARMGDCWYVNPHNRLDTITAQVDLYRRELDALGKPFPEEFPMRREVFVAATREEALKLSRPFIEAKYAAYHDWGQDKEMPAGDDDLSLAFDELAGDRFLIGSPDDVAEQIVALNKRLGVNHFVMSVEQPGMPVSLVHETLEILATEVMPRVRQSA